MYNLGTTKKPFMLDNFCHVSFLFNFLVWVVFSKIQPELTCLYTLCQPSANKKSTTLTCNFTWVSATYIYDETKINRLHFYDSF